MDPPECSGHAHDHEHADDLGLSLRPQIDMQKVSCLNEEVDGAGRLVLKLHEDRLSALPSLTSPEDDPELLLFIPFTEAVTVQSVSIRCGGGEETSSAKTVKLFANRDNLDFETARDMDADMKLELLPPHHFADGSIDYPCRPAGRFQNVSSISLFVEDNYAGDDEEMATEITFIGLKGKGTKVKRLAVEAVYESRGMKKDHKVPEGEYGNQNFIG